MIQYPIRSVERAERSLRCSPFHLALFATMQSQSIPLNQISGASGVNLKYVKKQLSELATENALTWLIQVGVLRREVDGQGITDRYRLTPLGRSLVEKCQVHGGEIPPASFLDHLMQTVSRGLAIFNWGS